MLKTIDVLIGFTLVMLIMAMAVTMLTQLVTSAANLRGLALKQGIAKLLTLLDRGLDANAAQQLADYLLRNPLVAETNLWGQLRLGTAVHREELTKLLLDLAAATPATLPADIRPLQASLQASLAANGIAAPQATLDGIRKTALELEKTNPEMANHERMNAAILHNASSDYVAKLNAWFDQTMDRVSALFTMHARVVTGVIALVVAVVLQLDAVTLINRLSTDDKLRQTLVSNAIEHPERYAPPARPSTTGGAPQSASSQPNVLDTLKQHGLGDLMNANLVEIPSNIDDWARKWWGSDGTQAAAAPSGPGAAARANPEHMLISKIIGVLISAALISLGAPFWYELLKNLIRLRSLVATKDEGERKERQTTQAPDATPAARSPGGFPPALAGERGNLAAVG
jgi:hypothetical protein